MTVLERDAAPPPPAGAAAQAWDGWARPGVAQFHQPHNLFSRARLVLDEELPGMVDRLADAGCVWVDPLTMGPPSRRCRLKTGLPGRAEASAQGRRAFVGAKKPGRGT